MTHTVRAAQMVGVRELARRERELKRVIGHQLMTIREDAGLTRAEVARAAGIDRAHYSRIERGETGASLEVLTAIGAVLGCDLSVRYFPGSGPRIRDRFQAPIIEALIGILDQSWVPQPEVPVMRPVRGVIDLVLRREIEVVACEVQSELRRLEQVLRWSAEKAAALERAAEEPPASRLLVVRSTTATREIARRFEATLRAACPAMSIDAFRALSTPAEAWPGPAILWARLEGGRAEILERPPRGVRIGR
jgi:transcriptional regulator with XRE-family HTH domain